MELENIVIGSGPAGVACAVALLAAGQRVLMVDGGQTLEAARAEKLVRMREMEPREWSGAAGAWMREGMRGSREGIPLKLAYGSDFPYRTIPGAARVEGVGVNTRSSMGKGGLSAVWGGAVMPYRQADMVGWPVTAEELEEHYRAVLEFMPVAQMVDALQTEFPVFKATEAMPLSVQAAAVLGDLQRRQVELRGQGVKFGRSRLAVDAGRCVRCGMCMYGCPGGFIWSAGETVEALRGRPEFTYAGGLVAQRVAEDGDGAQVEVVRADGEREVLRGRRVFVAAGVLGSTALMLRSLGAYGTAVALKESHYFLLPMLRMSGVEGFARGDLHTLAQLYVEVMDAAVSPYAVHLQAYTYNDLMEQAMRRMLGPLSAVVPWDAVMSRMVLLQGYLHSEDSAGMRAELERDGDGDVLRLSAEERAETGAVRKRLVRKLAGLSGMTGLRPLGMLLRAGEPGRGFHTGGSFPMSAAPVGMESDVLGRVAGMRRVHVVDASVMPSIAASTVTFTAMANAHRIGTLAARGGAA